MADTDAGTDQVSGFLKQKAGPLPVGVWIMAVGGGIAIAWYMRRNAAASSAADATVTDPTTDYTQGGNTYTPPGVGGAAGSGAVTPVPTAPADNDEWFTRAANFLVGKGLSGAQVNYSLGQFMSGAPLSGQDRAIVDMAIASVGNPPVAPPPAANKPPDPPISIPRPVPSMPKPNGPAKATKPGSPVRPHLVSQSIGRATVGVTSVRGATAYIWLLNGQQANTTPGPEVTLTQLSRHTRYSVSVIPQNAAGRSAESGRTDFVSK